MSEREWDDPEVAAIEARCGRALNGDAMSKDVRYLLDRLAVAAPAVSADTPESDPTAGLPPDLVRLLRDPTIRLPQDDVKLADGRSLWDHLEEWRNAPSNTASAPPAPAVSADTPEALAQRFHEAYERLAPSFGYETRKESAVAWEDVPEPNRSLMVAVAAEVLAAVSADTRLIEAAEAWREVRQRAEAYREAVGMPADADGFARLAKEIEAEADAADELIAALAVVSAARDPEGQKA